MKITFLGTSDGVPRLNHYCTSTMIEVGENIYIIDTGAPVYNKILEAGRDPARLKAIFYTHSHSDHIDGVIQFLHLCLWKFKTYEFDIFWPQMSIAEAAVNYVCSYYEEDFPRDRIRNNRIMGEGIVYEDEFIRITATLNRHIENSYSFLVEADGRRVVFSGDLSQNLKGDDFPKILSEQEVDLFICEMAHFGEDEVLPYLKTCKAKRVIFNHYQKVKEEHIERLSVAGRFPFPVSMAQDMQSIEL